MVQGTAFVDEFRYATKPDMVQIWNEEVKPNLQEYPTVMTYKKNNCFKLNIRTKKFPA